MSRVAYGVGFADAECLVLSSGMVCCVDIERCVRSGWVGLGRKLEATDESC